MKETRTEKIWAVSMAPGASQVPVHVSPRIKNTAAWHIHQMKEVGDPSLDPEPVKTTGRPTKAESVTIERLRKERDELQAKFDALAKEQSEKAAKEPKTETANA